VLVILLFISALLLKFRIDAIWNKATCLVELLELKMKMNFYQEEKISTSAETFKAVRSIKMTPVAERQLREIAKILGIRKLRSVNYSTLKDGASSFNGTGKN
jgi:hypothetical protein